MLMNLIRQISLPNKIFITRRIFFFAEKFIQKLKDLCVLTVLFQELKFCRENWRVIL